MKKYSLLVKQFIVLSLFIIIPVITITFISNYIIMKYSETEISKSGMSKLHVSKGIVDLISQTITNDSINLSLNSKLNDIYGFDDMKQTIKSSDNIYTLYQFQTVLENIVRSNTLYSTIYLLLDNSNFVVTNTGVYLKDEFADKALVKTYKKFKDSFKPISWINPRPIDSIGSKYVLSYIFPLTPYTTKLRGSIAINIPETSLSTKINSNNFYSGDNIGIIDSNGNVISNADKSLLSHNISKKDYISRILKSNSVEGYFINSINNKKYLVTYLKTGTNNWIYFGVFSLNALNNKINSMKITIIYISLGFLVSGILLSFIISRKLYNPVKKLVHEIKSRKGLDIIGSKDEVSLLSQIFDQMIKEEDQLFNAIEKSNKNLRENYLQGLLRGRSSVDEEPVNLFPHKNFLCCIISIDKYKDFVINFSDEQQYYLKTVILNLTEKTINSSFTCYGMAMEGDRIVIFVNPENDNPDEVLEILREHLAIIQKEAEKVIETSITVYMGNLYGNIQKIRTSYYEAQSLIKLKFLYGHGKILSVKDNPTSICKYYYPINIEKQILNNIDVGSKASLINSVSDLINEIKEKKELNYDNAMLALNQLLGSTVKYLLEQNISVDKIFGSNYDIYSKLVENETLDEAGLFLANIFLQIIEYRDKCKIDSKSRISIIMDYIHNNYKKDIDINTLAEHVGLSYPHLRKIFNSETGENIVNYINNLRIEEAQRILRQTNLNINEIAISLGYNNKQSFIRFFKKYVGINPGEYRNIKSR